MRRAFVIALSAVIALCLFLVAGSSAHPMWGIAADRQGQVYFSDLKNVWKIDAQGKLSIFRAGGEWHTHDLNTDEAGNLYGADNSYDPATKRFFGSVWKMTPAGEFSYILTPTENLPAGTSIWKDRDGNMYHAANYPKGELLVLKRTPGGTVTALAGKSDAVRRYRQGVPYSVGGMAFGTDGALYFVHGANVSKITVSGALIAVARNPAADNASGNPAGETSLFGIAVDAPGNVFVADHGNRRVLKITPDNKIAVLLRAEGTWFPTGVAAQGGELYVLEESHAADYAPLGIRVRKLSADGRVSVLATVGEPATVGENTNPPARPAPASAAVEEVGAPDGFSLSRLFGLSAGFFILSFVVWRIYKRRLHI